MKHSLWDIATFLFNEKAAETNPRLCCGIRFPGMRVLSSGFHLRCLRANQDAAISTFLSRG